MTKYILAGGFMSKAFDGGKSFYNEIVVGFRNQRIKILLCMFAEPKEKWNEAFEKEKKVFIENYPDLEIDFQIAEYDILLKQIEESNIVIFKGGSTERLLQMIIRNSDLKKSAFEGKTIVGNSAGAYCLCSKYLTVDEFGNIALLDGLGILPIKIVTHYRSVFYPEKYTNIFSWEKVDALFKDCDFNLKLCILKEGEYFVIHI